MANVRSPSLDARPLNVPTLAFHHISSEISSYTAASPDFFATLIATLAARHVFVSISDIVRWANGGCPFPENAILLTFDDAYEDSYRWLIWAADTHGATGVVFAIARYIGRHNRWNTKCGYVARHLSAVQLRSLLRRGYELGSHTRSHHNLLKFGRAELSDELAGSKLALEHRFDAAVQAIAYPFGFHSALIREVAAQHYRFGFASERESFGTAWHVYPYAIKRVMITSTSSVDAVVRAIDVYRDGESL